MSVGSYNIRQIIDAITRGQIRIPAFQRGFVWEPERIAHLMDSIYKGYPFGSLLLWRTTGERLSVEKDLGPFVLPAPEKDFPVDYVLDGQQRITSIFGVFQNSLKAKAGSLWPQIYFDLSSDTDPQSTQFLALEDKDVDKKKHFPLSTLFDTVEYRKSTSIFGVDIVEKIDKLQAIFKEAAIPYQMVETNEKSKVAIIFERVNTQGVELDTLQLLTAWTWSDDFQLHEQFKDLAEELEPFGFAGLGQDSNLILRCCSAILRGESAPDALLEAKGGEVRAQFPLIKNGVKGAIDFLRSEFGIQSLNNLPYPALLVPLSVFFACADNTEVNYTNAQKETISKWFWRTAFARRYSSGFPRNILNDIQEMKKLRENKPSILGNFSLDLTHAFFTENTFRLGSVNTNTFVLMLANNSPKSFISGKNLDLSEKLKAANREEFHHMMPKAFLKSSNQTQTHNETCLANFCFLSRADNRELGGVAPSIYKSKMPAKYDDIIAAALCPESLFDDNYDVFITERTDKLINHAKKLSGID